MWKWCLFQSLVAFAVVAANIHYEFTPNGYLAGLIAMAASYLATVFASWFLLRLRRSRVRPRNDSGGGKMGLIAVARGARYSLEQPRRTRIGYDPR